MIQEFDKMKGRQPQSKDDIPKLMRETLRVISHTPDDIPDEAKAADTIRRMLMNLATISNNLVELRNDYGAGHGREVNT